MLATLSFLCVCFAVIAASCAPRKNELISTSTRQSYREAAVLYFGMCIGFAMSVAVGLAIMAGKAVL